MSKEKRENRNWKLYLNKFCIIEIKICPICEKLFTTHTKKVYCSSHCLSKAPNWNEGKKGTYKHKKIHANKGKLGKSRPQVRIKCQYCGIKTITTNYKRWHGEKCKYK